VRIAQVSTMGKPVRRDGTDSIQQHVWLLTDRLIDLDHEVTVFASADSETSGELVGTLPGSYGKNGAPGDWRLCEWINICRAIEESARFDVIHIHAYLWGMPLQGLTQTPLIHTLHIMPQNSYDSVGLWSLWPKSRVTAISNYQWSAFPQFDPMAVIYHGVDPTNFMFRAEPDDYLCFLGRFTDQKSPLKAIKTAKNLGMRILLAGPEDDYYRAHIAPLVDGKSVEFMGFVDGQRRSQLLAGARALLYPINQPEPFGLVLIESMMCGTPVAVMGMGAVPEIVDEGITGCTAASLNEFPEAVRRAVLLDRHEVRRQAVARFSADRMAREYSKLYAKVAANG
jgi:glycosyltransferase involved in cell wall biosynthesis